MKKLKFRLQLVAEDEEESTEEVVELAVLEKDCERLEHLGLSLTESKDILGALQQHVLERQAAIFVDERRCCLGCGRRLGLKGRHNITFRTLFGDIDLDSPRLRRCRCSPEDTVTFSPLTELLAERTSPELLYLQTKWSSLISYGITAKMLKDVLPIDEKLNAATARNHALGIARRFEEGLGEEQFSFVDSCPAEWRELPPAEGPMTVGIDGGYVRDWNNKKSNFEVIVGRSARWEGEAKRFGFVHGHDDKPKRRLFELLQFHLTMRITILDQYAKGIARLDEKLSGEIGHDLQRVKWYCWHGNVYEALRHIRFVEMDAEELFYGLEEDHPTADHRKPKKLLKAIGEFRSYIESNAAMIPNYGERRRYGEAISTAAVESTVNAVVNKRFCKKQQMQWSKEGAHLLLQNRTKTLNRELADTFRRWYPEFTCSDGEQEEEPVRAVA